MIGDLKFEVWDKKWEKLPLLGTAHIAMATAITVKSLDDSSSTEPKKLLDILNVRAAKAFYYTAANGNFVYSQTRSRVPRASIDSMIKTKNVKR